MKTLKLCLFSLLAIALCVGAGTVENISREQERRFAKAEKCWGKIKVVGVGADFKVRVTDMFPDLNVKETIAPSSVGEWILSKSEKITRSSMSMLEKISRLLFLRFLVLIATTTFRRIAICRHVENRLVGRFNHPTVVVKTF